MKGAVFLFQVLAIMLLNLLQMTTAAKPTAAPVLPVGDLRGKMFTLSQRDTVTFRSSSPGSPYTATTNLGVSVCLRYIAENRQQTIFTLSPSSRGLDNQLKFDISSSASVLSYQKSSLPYILNFMSYRAFWDNESSTKLWTSVCVVVDTRKGVAQVFNGKTASVRKRTQYIWDGEQALVINGFEGQITDIQMWDYPLLKEEARQYLTQYASSATFRWTKDSVVSWSRMRYESNSSPLVEDAYPMK